MRQFEARAAERSRSLFHRARVIAGLAAAFLVWFILPAAAQRGTADVTGAVPCQLRGFAIDPDPAGSNIRSRPRADAPVIGHLPARVRLSASDSVGAEFELVGSRDGWLLIGNVRSGTADRAVNVFDGPGWISGMLAGVTLGDPVLRAAPRRDAAVVSNLADPGWGPSSYTVSRIHACKGKYAEITARRFDGKQVHGWTWGPCVSQLTTCDWSGPGAGDE